jgi:FdhD protein
MYLKEFNTISIKNNSKVKETSLIAAEDAIALFVNDAKIASLTATPNMLRELAVGHLICEGMIDDPHDIMGVQNKGLDIYVQTREDPRLERESIAVVSSGAKFTVDCIKNSLHHLGSEVYEKTRGTHSASLVDQDGNLVKKAIDVGRHNTVDKVVGSAILDGISLHNLFLLSTARQSAGIVMKVARAGIPVIVSKAAPISSGIESAKKMGVTLVCFAKKDNLSIYSHPDRILVGG